MGWAFLPLRKYADFSGRSRRKEYWMFSLLILLLSFSLVVFEGNLDPAGVLGGFHLACLLLALLLVTPFTAVGVRRLHDTDRSGLWLLVGLIPPFGTAAVVYFLVLEGTVGANRYGPDPLASERGPVRNPI